MLLKKPWRPFLLASQSIKEDVSDDLDVLLEGLDDFDLLLYSFSDKVYEGLSEFNNGLKTNYSHLFLDLDEKMYNRNISGVIMVSDGCYNAGINPEYLSYNFPIYSIALGDTVTYKDVRIDDVRPNDQILRKSLRIYLEYEVYRSRI